MIIYHTDSTMPTRKIAVTVEAHTLEEIDRLVRESVFPNRSRAVQKALEETLERVSKNRLRRECLKLDPAEERRDAETGLEQDNREWPIY
jgi:Arc/MetJ-type ribon-helix-helix transcriptional regulator